MDRRPVHVAHDSLFSMSSGWTNYRGFFNLAFLLLIISNGRVALENLIKYGILINPAVWVVDVGRSLHPFSPYVSNLLIVLGSNVTILIVLLAEKALAARWVGNRFAALFYPFLFVLHLTLPAVYVLNTNHKGNPLYAFMALELVVIEMLKLVSYVHVNYWYRKSRDSLTKQQNGYAIKDSLPTSDNSRRAIGGDGGNSNSPVEDIAVNGEGMRLRRSRRLSSTSLKSQGHLQEELMNGMASKGTSNPSSSSPKRPSTSQDDSPSQDACDPLVHYPTNLTLSNIYYFMCAPTLCYELQFPRTPACRKRFIVKRLVELIGFAFVILALCQQWILPLLRNSLAPFSEMDLKRCLERVLKLAIPNHIVWLMLFYWFFHSFLNLTAELLRFADREFYLDFWNAESIGTFWRTWNIPVHRWAVRHIYKPFTRNGWGRLAAATAVFIVSAFFHEYLVSVPLKMFRLWACAGMLAQLPLGILTDKYLKGGRAGNIVVWLSLILGQPMAILAYLHDWYLLNYPEEHQAAIALNSIGGGFLNSTLT